MPNIIGWIRYIQPFFFLTENLIDKNVKKYGLYYYVRLCGSELMGDDILLR